VNSQRFVFHGRLVKAMIVVIESGASASSVCASASLHLCLRMPFCSSILPYYPNYLSVVYIYRTKHNIFKNQLS
jgi:hypothetical protein